MSTLQKTSLPHKFKTKIKSFVHHQTARVYVGLFIELPTTKQIMNMASKVVTYNDTVLFVEMIGVEYKFVKQAMPEYNDYHCIVADIKLYYEGRR